MRIAAVLVLVVATAFPCAAADEGPSPEKLFQKFGLFGTWAKICTFPASPTNPYVTVTEPSPGVIVEEHRLGGEYTVNRYSVLSAQKMSDTRLAVEVLFNPGSAEEERQKLIFEIHDQTRRTVLNETDRGPVRVRGGIAVPRGTETPLLHKCK